MPSSKDLPLNAPETPLARQSNPHKLLNNQITGRLRILGTTDLHMQLRGFDYYTDTPMDNGGLARVATCIAKLRTEAEARGELVLVCDNGDSLQGTPLDAYAMDTPERPHLFYRALEMIGYDAAGLGNHDFNFGLPYLAQSLTNASVPMLCSNAFWPEGIAPLVQHSIILERSLQGHALRIGLFSVLPPQTMIWDAHHLGGRLNITDITETARGVVNQLRNQDCDLVIALAHTGLGENDHKPGQENAVWPLSRIAGLDAILAGHQHLLVPDPISSDTSDTATGVLNGTPVVMPGSSGAYLGVIDLDLTRKPDGWAVKGRHATLSKVEGAADKRILALTDPLHQKTRSGLSACVGQSPLPLQSYFSLVAPCPAMTLIADAQRQAVEEMATLPPDIPLLSSVSPAKMGGRGGPDHYTDIPAGPLSLRHVLDLCFFPNSLCAVIVTGAQLREWLEASAGIYSRIIPGATVQNLLDPDRPAFASDLFFGIEYEIDLTRPARFHLDGSLVDPQHQRITQLQYQERDVEDNDRFAVALSSYRANGGGNIAVLKEAQHLQLGHDLMRDAVQRYLQAGHFPDVPYQETGRFAPLGGTEVILKTGPSAQAHIEDLGPLYKRSAGVDDEGFLQLVLEL